MADPTPKTAPNAKSKIGLKNMVVAPIVKDTEEELEYGPLQLVAGSIEASISPENADADVQYADDVEWDALYPDPEITFNTTLVDLPLVLQSEILGHKLDDNGVLVKSDADKPGYYAVGFKSEKSDHTYRYVWLYKVRAKPITENFGTKEGSTINRQTQEVEWTAVKRIHDGKYQAVADEGENGFTAEKGKEFLKSVYTPSFTDATPNP